MRNDRRTTLRVPAKVLNLADHIADQEGLTRSMVLRRWLLEKVEEEQAAEWQAERGLD